MFIFLSVNIVWYRQKCYAEVVIFQTNGSSLFVASVARRRRRFVYDVSVCPVGDMDGPENPKTAQVMSNANKMPSQTSGLYRRFGLYIMSGGFVIQPGSQMCNFARAWGLWVIITVRFFFFKQTYQSGLAFTWCAHLYYMFTNRPEEVLLLDMLVKRFIYWPHPLLTHILIGLVFCVWWNLECLNCFRCSRGWGRLLLFSCSASICEGEKLGRSDNAPNGG